MSKPEMAPSYDRRRTSPAKITDFESTAMLQGRGFQVTRVETEIGSGRAHITWRQIPVAHDQRAVETQLGSLYSRFSHGT